MTVVFFVRGDSLQSEVGRKVALPVGIAPDGRIVSSGEVAVLLADDQKNIELQQLEQFRWTGASSWAVLHPPLLPARQAWLQQRGLRQAPNQLSHQHSNFAYNQVLAVLRSPDDDTRREQCARVVQSYATDGLLVDLEALAARIALRPWFAGQSAQGAPEAEQRRGRNEGEIRLALNDLIGRLRDRGGALLSLTVNGNLKAPEKISVEDVEAAAAALLP